MFVAQASATSLSTDERIDIVEQALVLLRDVYPHLAAKRALYGVDPTDRLGRLRDRLAAGEPPLDDVGFHRELVSIFASVRDLHTAYLLPTAFHRQVAALPFLIEPYGPPGEEHYIVTATRKRSVPRDFSIGTEILHWNGVPIARAVELQGEGSSGANPAARHAKGVERLTFRYLGLEFAPDEEWIHVGYRGRRRERFGVFAWKVVELPEELPLRRHARFALGVDFESEAYRRLRVDWFAAPRPEPSPDPDDPDVDLRPDPSIPGVPLARAFGDRFQFRTVADGAVGYLRIFAFPRTQRDRFVTAVTEVLERAPAGGLIIDVRHNPGGDVCAAEDLLQLLTGREIEPEGFMFRASQTARRIALADQAFLPWQAGFDSSLRTDAELTPPAPLDGGAADALGQRYQGPVVLIVDAQSYSATDIFAAGFQDHGIGTVIGCAATTGAGGATVAAHGELAKLELDGGNPLHCLASGASFRVALRRSVRVLDRRGEPVEDFGVTPDRICEMTRDDLMNRNRVLIEKAVLILGEQPERPRLSCTRRAGVLRGEARGIDRVVLLAGDRVHRDQSVTDGPLVLELSDAELQSSGRLRLVGYAGEIRVVSFWVPPEAAASDDLPPLI